MTDRIAELITKEQGIFLDLGCGDHKEKRAIGMDKRALPGIDIVHDIETFPWPLPDGVCYRILASHLFEHIKPWLMLELMDECWRVMKDHGQLLVVMPYPGSPRFYQDPTHIKAWNETTPLYFSCAHELWNIYKPKCWEIEKGFPQYHQIGDLHVIMNKRRGDHSTHHEPKD